MLDSGYCISDDPDAPKIGGHSLSTIIRNNDLPKLNQYLASFHYQVIRSLRVPCRYNPFFLAAAEAEPETLQALLEAHAAGAEPRESWDPQGCGLLHAACSGANLDMVRFILDSYSSQGNQLPLGAVGLHGRSHQQETPILVAASLLPDLGVNAEQAGVVGADRDHWIRDRVVMAEELINFLLDRGSLATDVVPSYPNATGADRQPQGSVLGLAVTRASGGLVQRLINHGADVYLQHQHFHHHHIAFFRGGDGTDHTHNATTLHLASQFWHADIVKLLLDYHKVNHVGPDPFSPRDSNGRLPLHWAAGGAGDPECMSPDNTLTAKITETFRLLLEHDPRGINLRDDTGSTPLYYAAGAHATCGGSKHAELAIKCLLGYGADPSNPNDDGQTVLHILAYRSINSDPIGTELLESLVAHGVDVNHADKRGKTALRIMAQNLRQVSVVKFLVEHGADVRTADIKGDTPFHAAAKGILNPYKHRDGRMENPTMEDKLRSQDEAMRILREAAGVDVSRLMMNQRNLESKTPQQVLGETRNRWGGIAAPRTRR